MNYLMYALTALFSTGCVIPPLWFGVKATLDRERMLGLFILGMVFPICGIVAALPWLLMADAASPDLAVLKKNAWRCSQSHTETTTTLVKSGASVIPITNEHSVCDQYNRK